MGTLAVEACLAMVSTNLSRLFYAGETQDSNGNVNVFFLK